MACIPDLYLKYHFIEKDMPEEIIKIIKEITEDRDIIKDKLKIEE